MSESLRIPKQARSRATLTRMRAATQSLLIESGGAGPTVEDIAARAKTSIGAFYARYEGKDAALADAHEQHWGRWRRRWERHLAPDRWEGRTAAEVVAGVIRHLGRSQFRDPLPLRAFWLSALGEPSGTLIRHTVALDGYVADAVSLLLASREPGLRSHARRRTAREGLLMVIGALRDRVMSAVDGIPSEREQRRLIVTLVQMYAALLDVGPTIQTYSDVLRHARRAPRFPRN